MECNQFPNTCDTLFKRDNFMARIQKDTQELKKDIMEACIALFNKKGLKFTMDDVATYCHISKKTMYVVFNDKEELFFAMVDYLFDGIKESKEAVLNDPSLSTLEKVKRILGAMPESYNEIDFEKMYLLKEKYPKTYEKVEKRLETEWETTIALLQKGQAEGVIKSVNIPLVKLIYEASIEQFFKRDVLVANNIPYKTAVDEVVDILIGGISAR